MMIVWLAALAALTLFRVRIEGFHEGFLDRQTTDSIKGVFILIVLLSHVRSYVSAGEGVLNSAYNAFFVWLGQLMVAMFLFYSGYGCFESYKNKKNYLSSFLKNRVCKTLFHFALAVSLFAVLNAVLKIHYPARNYLFCWIGWESIGNSNWYIFTILMLYLMSWLSFSAEKGIGKKGLISIPAVTILCVAYIFFMHRAGKESWWYDTALCFPCGMAVSFFKPYCLSRIRKTAEWAVWTILTGAAFVLLYEKGGLWFFPCACVFCLLVVLISARVRIENRPLIWAGRHLFEIYILQRIPMIVLWKLSVTDPMIFVAVTIPVTLALAAAFHRLTEKLDAVVFP